MATDDKGAASPPASNDPLATLLPPGQAKALVCRLGGRSLVLVGLMGAGKSCIGRRLGSVLDLPFIDSDHEIEAAAGCSISDIFAHYGEEAFREGERRVIARLLAGESAVLATGGGAFMDGETRALIKAQSVSIWLRAELDVLFRRCSRRTHRPLLRQGDPRAILDDLMQKRYPVYTEADVVVESEEVPPEETVARVLQALDHFLPPEAPTTEG